MDDDGHSSLLILIKHKGNNNNNTKPTKAGKQEVDDRLREVQDRKKSGLSGLRTTLLTDCQSDSQSEGHSTN